MITIEEDEPLGYDHELGSGGWCPCQVCEIHSTPYDENEHGGES